MPASYIPPRWQPTDMSRNKKAAPPKEVAKVRVTIWLDSAIVDYFKGRARLPGAAGYQTQINDELRALTEGGGGSFASLVNDKRFIAAVAEQVIRQSRQGKKK